MRIAIAHSFYRIPGGEDRYVRQQVELLSGRHEVHLIEESNLALSEGLALASRMVFSRQKRDQLSQRLRSLRPDLIHLHNPYPAFGPAVHLAARGLDIPLVVTVHNNRLRCPNGLTFTEGSPCFRCTGGNTAHAVLHECFPSRRQAAAYASALWIHRFPLQLEKVPRLFVAPSEFMKARLTGWGIESDRVVVVRNFTTPPPVSRSEPREGGLYLGRLDIGKGLETLLDALAAAGDPAFVIAGAGPLAQSLVERAHELGLKRLRFVGVLDRPEVGRAVRAARFLAVPSECDENAPLAALEAMAAGCPLLVSDKGGLPELAQLGAGVTFRAGDRDALARELRNLSTDSGLAERLGHSARQVAERHFAPAAHRIRLEEVYSAALSRS